MCTFEFVLLANKNIYLRKGNISFLYLSPPVPIHGGLTCIFSHQSDNLNTRLTAKILQLLTNTQRQKSINKHDGWILPNVLSPFYAVCRDADKTTTDRSIRCGILYKIVRKINSDCKVKIICKFQTTNCSVF